MGELTDPRCSNCKHWDREGYQYEYHDFYDSDPDSEVEERVLDHRKCLKVVHLYSDVPVRPAVAFVLDASGYSASLWTTSDFGCVCFEPREQ